MGGEVLKAGRAEACEGFRGVEDEALGALGVLLFVC